MERLVDFWESARPSLRQGTFLFELTTTGAVVIYCFLLGVNSDYLLRLSSFIGDGSISTVHGIQTALMIGGVLSLGVTCVGTWRHFHVKHQRLRWRRAAMLLRGVFLCLLGITQLLSAPQWPGGGLINIWLAAVSVLAETGQEVTSNDLNTSRG